jgi:lipopolysaccharide export system protein LptA
MNQESGDFTASGNVSSTRVADSKPGTGGGMLARGEPLQAKAASMVSTRGNRHIVYDGKAVLWQTGNRLEATRITIDRDAKALDAQGAVVSQFLDKKTNPKTGRAPVTVVRASTLRYEEDGKVAHYRGPVRLIRDAMDVKSRELRAWMSDDETGDSSLDRTFADGAVEIFQAEPGRTRRGTSEHAEYYIGDEKVILNGGIAQMVDSRQGTTRGKQLTYWTNNDTLQVEGALTQPVVSRIQRK